MDGRAPFSRDQNRRSTPPLKTLEHFFSPRDLVAACGGARVSRARTRRLAGNSKRAAASARARGPSPFLLFFSLVLLSSTRLREIQRGALPMAARLRVVTGTGGLCPAGDGEECAADTRPRPSPPLFFLFHPPLFPHAFLSEIQSVAMTAGGEVVTPPRDPSPACAFPARESTPLCTPPSSSLITAPVGPVPHASITVVS
jgi:hypothetical protein